MNERWLLAEAVVFLSGVADALTPGLGDTFFGAGPRVSSTLALLERMQLARLIEITQKLKDVVHQSIAMVFRGVLWTALQQVWQSTRGVVPCAYRQFNGRFHLDMALCLLAWQMGP